jgi:hypothetical protein
MKKAKNILLISVLSLFGLFLFSNSIALADSLWDMQKGMGETGMAFGQDSEAEDVRFQIVRIINIILSFLGIIAVVLIIFAGFQWMTAAGNEEQIKKAKGLLKNAVIGLAIILMAWSITYFIMTRLWAVATDQPYYLDPSYF